MSKQPKEISIDWPPKDTIRYQENKELEFVIPLEEDRRDIRKDKPGMDR